jgi:hypothetical protein
MAPDKTERTWAANWRKKIVDRTLAEGCCTLSEYLARFPGRPYIELAQGLGEDVAAVQLEWIHVAEAKEQGHLRRMAMDSLARDINGYLPSGWRHGAENDFETALAFSVWAVRLKQCVPELESKLDAVWDALEELRPPVGWTPSGPDDEVICKAFSKGWPEYE